MSRLEAAKEWYEARLGALMAIEDWMRDRPDVPKVLQPVVKDFYDKKLGREQIKRERAELKRLALVRLFAGFEADFRERLCMWLVAKLNIAHPDPSGLRSAQGISTALPDSIESCVTLFRSLEPRFQGSDKNWLDKLRAYRNDLMHSGFPDIEPAEEPMRAYESLKRILAHLDTESSIG